MRSWIPLALLAMGCGGNDDEDKGDTDAADADADSDADADADSDADTDSDADSDADADTGDTGPDPSCPVEYVPPVVDYDDCNSIVYNDTDFDGTANSVVQRSFDASGNLTNASFDQGNDGTIESTTTWTYDASGNVVEQMIAEVGPPVALTTTTYTYDAGGNLIEESVDGPGPQDTTTTYVVGPCGPISSETDIQNDGTINSSSTYAYTPTSVTIENDVDDDGTIDSTTVSTLDAALGRVDQIAVENDPHAGAEITTINTWDATTGLLTSQETTRWTGSANVMSVMTFMYDGDDREISATTISGVPPMPSPPTTTTWSCGP